MGRSYCFECSKCGYRAIVSGGMDRGVQFWVQTVHCRDCRALHDAVTRLKAADERTLGGLHKASGIAGKKVKKAKMGHQKDAPDEPKRKRIAVIVWKRTARGGLSGRTRFMWEDEL